MEGAAVKKLNKRLYDFGAGSYCGVFMPEKVMRKLAKLNAKHSAEVRLILDEHKDELYPSHWTLANKRNGESIERQLVIRYALKNERESALDHRISLFKAPEPKYFGGVYLVNSHEEAKEIAETLLRDELEVA